MVGECIVIQHYPFQTILLAMSDTNLSPEGGTKIEKYIAQKEELITGLHETVASLRAENGGLKARIELLEKREMGIVKDKELLASYESSQEALEGENKRLEQNLRRCEALLASTKAVLASTKTELQRAREEAAAIAKQGFETCTFFVDTIHYLLMVLFNRVFGGPVLTGCCKLAHCGNDILYLFTSFLRFESLFLALRPVYNEWAESCHSTPLDVKTIVPEAFGCLRFFWETIPADVRNEKFPGETLETLFEKQMAELRKAVQTCFQQPSEAQPPAEGGSPALSQQREHQEVAQSSEPPALSQEEVEQPSTGEGGIDPPPAKRQRTEGRPEGSPEGRLTWRRVQMAAQIVSAAALVARGFFSGTGS